MELITKTIGAYSGVIGCLRHDRDAMIAFTHEAETEPSAVHDLFLTKEQAASLIVDLENAIKRLTL